MVWVMGGLSVAHIYRTVTDFGGYHLDFSTPLMIIVQKLSLVAFAVHDGEWCVGVGVGVGVCVCGCV